MEWNGMEWNGMEWNGWNKYLEWMETFKEAAPGAGLTDSRDRAQRSFSVARHLYAAPADYALDPITECSMPGAGCRWTVRGGSQITDLRRSTQTADHGDRWMVRVYAF